MRGVARGLSAWRALLSGVAALLVCAPAAPQPEAAAAPAALVFNLAGHHGPVRRIAVDPAGRRLLTASDDKTALVWDLASGQLAHVLRVPVGEDEAGRLYGAAISPDGSTAAVAGTAVGAAGARPRVHLFDLASGAWRGGFALGAGAVRHLAWAAGGELLAAVTVNPASFRVYRREGGLLFETLLPADAYGLSITPAGQAAVTAFDGRVRLYRLSPEGVQADGELATGLPDPVGVRHSPDGRWLAVGFFSRAARGQVAVEVFDLQQRGPARRLLFDDLRFGNLMTVGWRADGRALYAAGTGYNEPGRFVARRIAWPEGSSEAAVVAADSVQDIAALPDGRMVLAGFDAGWSVLDGLAVGTRSASEAPRVADAGALRISRDAGVLSWRTADGATRSFSLRTRRPGDGDPSADQAATAGSAFGLRVTDWENSRTPKIDGRALALLPNESARAAAVLPAGDGAVLATSRALRRVARDGSEVWTQPLPTEGRALALSADGRLLVVALADGTLRWRRVEDGAPLLSLLLLRDGRWVLWTEAGHFDAGPGAEDLIGWLVARPGGERVDYFGASRLRERFLRPDVIDRVLAERDAVRALALANDARLAAARAEVPDEVVKTLAATLAPVPVVQALPPVVTLLQGVRVETPQVQLALDYKLFVPGGAPVDRVSVRVDGRPVEASAAPPRPLGGGEAEGRVVVTLPKAEGRVQVFAESANGVSMPAEVQFRSSAAALRQPDRRPVLYLLSIGVSRYANPDFNLGLAAKDARDFQQMLTGQQGLQYRKVESRLLLDEQATRANVLAGLRWLQQSAGVDDVAILFIAGHGVADAADVYHFLTHDMKENALAQTAVSEQALRGTLAAIKGRALFFVDTCFSGKSVGRFSRRELVRMANGLASAELGVIVFSASAPRQESLEDPAWGNGAFTKALVEGLGGRADFRREGVVTHRGLDYYVAHAVRELTRGRQTPVTAVPNGIADFPLVAVTSAAVPPDTKAGALR